MEIYQGPWTYKKEATTLKEMNNRLPKGQIVRHPRGALMLACPKCGAIQRISGKVSGADNSPSIDKPILCGAGYCVACEYLFRIEDGQTVEVSNGRKRENGVFSVADPVLREALGL